MATRVEDLLQEARRRFRMFAAVVAFELALLGALAGSLSSLGPWVGAGAGAGVGLFAVFVIVEWGSRIDHKPRGLHLVKARNGAALLTWLSPVGPLWAPRLRSLLADPVLARHALSNHPEAGRLPDEELLSMIRARGALVTARNTGVGYVAASLSFGLVAVEGLEAAERGHFLWWTLTAASAFLGVTGIAQVLGGWWGGALLRHSEQATGTRFARLLPILRIGFPAGTFAAWAARVVIDDAHRRVPSSTAGTAPAS